MGLVNLSTFHAVKIVLVIDRLNEKLLLILPLKTLFAQFDFTIASFIAKLITMISFVKLVNEVLLSLFDCWNGTFILHIAKLVTATLLNFGMQRKHAQNQGHRWNVDWGGVYSYIHVLPDEFLLKSNSNSSV